MSDVVLDIQGLRKSFGPLEAVAGISLEVRAGEFFTLLGPNGAGKTTTLKLIVGLYAPDAGHIRIAGFDLLSEPDRARAQLGYIPDRPFFYDKLTGREYLDLVADLYEVDSTRKASQIGDLASIFQIGDKLDSYIESYSQGMRQKLALCGCFLHEPRVAIIDEPWVGLDPLAIRTVTTFLRDRCRQGTTVFMSTHTLSLAERLSDRTGILHRGKLVAVGTVSEILEGEPGSDLEQAFLGITGPESGIDLEEEVRKGTG